MIDPVGILRAYQAIQCLDVRDVQVVGRVNSIIEG